MSFSESRALKQTSRREFVSTALAGGIAATTLPATRCGAGRDTQEIPADVPSRYAILDQILKQPVLKRELFDSPVIMEDIELLRDRNSFLCRVRSKDGAVGVSVGHPNTSRISWPVMRGLIAQFRGKDARNLDDLITRASEPGAKSCGVPKNVHIATLEIAVLDMLGNIANKPIGELIGTIHHPRIAVYQGSRYGELRRQPPEKSLELVKKDLLESKAKAIKIRGGVGNQLGNDADNAPGRTEMLIRLTRETFGDDMVLMLDGNGSYSFDEAVRIGRLLEEYKYFFYEEPIPWDWYEEQKKTAAALDIPMAGGEEEFRMRAFRWLIANDAFDILQPDQLYFGGLIRSMRVARMAEACGKSIVPHMSTGGLGYLYMLHFVSACSNAGPYHEFKLFATRDGNRTNIPIESKAEPLTSDDGVIKVPTGPGLGIAIDPDYIKTHNRVDTG
jgi:L-alanine-DL-glutamate epimerase-like enolase superfamily enzyme